VRELRPQQIEFANVIENAIKKGGIAFAEGACGTGKSIAYSVPAILFSNPEHRVVISTAKKQLQNQLAADLPRLRDILAPNMQIASIKGKNNYLCRRLLKKNADLFKRQHKEELRQQLLEWLPEHPPGDRYAFPGDVDYPVSMCTAEECPGRCKYDGNCGYLRLKASLSLAQIVIVNHTLVGFDFSLIYLRGELGILTGGPYTTLIVDEAHTFTEAIRGAFSTDVTSAWCNWIIQRLDKEQVGYPNISVTTFKNEWNALFNSLPRWHPR
jgi:Rad3-related DNA helicase